MLNQNNAERLAKILGMLGSDHAGERAAAGLAAHRLLSDLSLTWHQVIIAPSVPTTVSVGSYDPPDLRTRPRSQQRHSGYTDWQRMARFAWSCRDRLRPRDQEFVRSMLAWRGPPTERQQDWLSEIYARLTRQETAG
jgi:hypothetical protein